MVRNMSYMWINNIVDFFKSTKLCEIKQKKGYFQPT